MTSKNDIMFRHNNTGKWYEFVEYNDNTDEVTLRCDVDEIIIITSHELSNYTEYFKSCKNPISIGDNVGVIVDNNLLYGIVTGIVETTHYVPLKRLKNCLTQVVDVDTNEIANVSDRCTITINDNEDVRFDYSNVHIESHELIKHHKCLQQYFVKVKS